MTTCRPTAALMSGACLIACLAGAGCVSTGVTPTATSAPAPAPPGAALQNANAVRDDWRRAESGMLSDHRQLTFASRFHKAGEAYFAPGNDRIIFQAIERPADGADPAEFYGMYVADLSRDDDGFATGLENIKRISPDGSANTCGWFHPTDPGVAYFASTYTPPVATAPPGYERKTGRYKWMFPPAMRVFRCDLTAPEADPGALELVAGDESAYQAEGALSPDGRHYVYCSLEANDGDLYVVDLESGRRATLVSAPGYDGGPFFSPDGRRICYRSDRAGNDLLQVYVADLAFAADGRVTGIEREYQLTRDAHVNWGPFWHPKGRHLVYATSRMGHRNYEVFLVDADPGTLPGSVRSIRYGTNLRRVTHASGADVLPVFSHDGRKMMWTSQRSPDRRSQLWVAEFVCDLDAAPGADAP